MKQIILLLLVIVSRLRVEPYKITRLSNEDIIYLERLNDIKMYHEYWKIVLGIDFEYLKHNQETIKLALSRYMYTICTRETSVCNAHARMQKTKKNN